MHKNREHIKILLAEERDKDRLLQESWLDISEIAEKVGYGSPSNFSTAFKAQTGMSPREYRNQDTHE